MPDFRQMSFFLGSNHNHFQNNDRSKLKEQTTAPPASRHRMIIGSGLRSAHLIAEVIKYFEVLIPFQLQQNFESSGTAQTLFVFSKEKILC